MSKLLASVDQKTQLAGTNRLELLMFTLDSSQTYAINVFKVQEVIRCPNLTQVPHAHSVVRGIANLRGRTIPIIDLGMAIGKRPLENPQDHTVIVSEYNRSVQGFLVGGMDRIINMNWEQILPPPSGLSSNAYLTAVTEIDGRLVQIVDVEKVLVEVMPRDDNVSDEVLADVDREQTEGLHVLVADDSYVARRQIQGALKSMGIRCTLATNGRAALDQLTQWADENPNLSNELLMVISDVEMPDMDGYSLTRAIRADPRLQPLHVVLHTSMSGDFNKQMIEGVGADNFIPKFQPDHLAKAVLDRVEEFRKGVPAA